MIDTMPLATYNLIVQSDAYTVIAPYNTVSLRRFAAAGGWLKQI
jgi:hypothetical protein